MEQSPRSQWNPEGAMTFFSGYAVKQINSGLFEAYATTAQDVIDNDPEEAGPLQAALFAEAPLGVYLEADTDDPIGPSAMVLAKIDLRTGDALPNTAIHTGISLDMHNWEFTISDTTHFTTDQAVLMRSQHFDQVMNGIELR